MSRTKVTHEGVALFIACHLEELTDLRHEESLHGLELVMATTDLRKEKPALLLTSLRSGDRTVSSPLLAFAVAHCPRLAEVILTSPGVTNDMLYGFMSLASLTRLHLSCKYSRYLNFYQGLLPVLDSQGHSMKHLVLEDFLEVDLDLIGDKCPRLEHLALARIEAYAPSGSCSGQGDRSFQKLQGFEVENKRGQGTALGEANLRRVLFNAPLERLVLQRVDTLSDDLLQEATEANPRLSHLQTLTLDSCHGITAKALWGLLAEPNDLMILRCWHCRNVHLKDSAKIKAAIKDNNLLLYFDWFPPSIDPEVEQELLEAGIDLDDEQ